jgi:hypothetical protein
VFRCRSSCPTWDPLAWAHSVWALPAAAVAAGLLVMSPSAAAQNALDPSLLSPTPESDPKKPARFGTWRKGEDRDTSRFQLGGQPGAGRVQQGLIRAI